MKRLKVIFFASYPNPDLPHWGVFNARAAQSLAQHVNLQVVSIRTWKPGRPLKRTESNNEVVVHHLFIPHVPTNSAFLFALSGVLTRWFLKLFLGKALRDAQVFHSVGGAPKGVYISRLALQLKKKHLVQLIGGDVNTDLPELRRNRALGTFPQGVDSVIGNSGRLVKQFNNLFRTAYPEEFVYRGTDLQHFSFAPLPPIAQGVRFLFIGGFSHYTGTNYGINTKGGLDLIETWLEHQEKLHKLKAHLTIAGPDADNIQPWLDQLKYPSSVALIGVLKPEDVREQYYQHHVVIIPSMEEGLPNVAVEASACGRAIIASDAGGIPEVVNEQTGFVFNRGNKVQLGVAILIHAQMKVDLIQKGFLARKKMENLFNSNQFGIKYFNYYNKLLQK